MPRVTELEYRGEKQSSLVYGNVYTYKEMAYITGLSYRCLVGRVARMEKTKSTAGKGLRVVLTDKELVPLNTKNIPLGWRNKTNRCADKNLENPVMEISQKWLGRKW